ncbi:hypothetical protein KIW84_031509 [Lathyrus oleraceus]|uniref:Uncharacterized protein n=1 Tax=Pisum sativum TaxID=3888 RepID=A0A9D4XQP6_PEA|nr:hypothetical protein KIW84_031509 [Pisum sativum]
MHVMSQKFKMHTSASWVDHVISASSSTFAREGSLERAFLDVGSSSDRGGQTLEEDKRICSEYENCIIPFHECTFEISGLRLPLNFFGIEVFNHFMIVPSHRNLVSWDYIYVFQ